MTTPSPFTVVGLAEIGYVDPAPRAAPVLPTAYTLGNLLTDLRTFADTYRRMQEQMAKQLPIVQEHTRVQMAFFASEVRAGLLAVPGVDELRAVAAAADQELTVEFCRRVVGALAAPGRGASAIEALSLTEVPARLQVAIEARLLGHDRPGSIVPQ